MVSDCQKYLQFKLYVSTSIQWTFDLVDAKGEGCPLIPEVR
jgi:hypothetical protein